MTYTIVITESGDWYLVQSDYADQFQDDEYKDKVDESKYVLYIEAPGNVLIKDFDLEE